MDLPGEIDSLARVVIAGVESEEVEEVNDAYKDILEDIGKSIISTIAEAGSTSRPHPLSSMISPIEDDWMGQILDYPFPHCIFVTSYPNRGDGGTSTLSAHA